MLIRQVGTAGCLLLAATAPIGAQSTTLDKVDISLSGEVRVRTEFDDRTSDTDADHATLLRTRLAALAKPSGEVSLFVQLSDSRAFGEESNTLTDASADRLDLHQAWLAWMPRPDVTLTVGRQELAFADERLVGTVGWANVTRAFDGIRLNLRAGAWTLDGFAANLDEQAALLATGLNPRVNEDEDDRALYGLWAATDHVDLFALGDRNATDGPDRTDIDRYTLGARGRKRFGPVALEATVAFQTGEQAGVSDRQDVEAYLASARADVMFARPQGGRLGMQIDILSGDRTPGDDTFGGFNTLYATNHKFYGFMDLFLNLPGQTGDLGLVDGIVRGSLSSSGWTLRADLHRFWLAEDNPAGERAIGYELDLTASRTLSGGLGFQAGYSLFSPSEAGEVAPIGLGGDTLHWAYVQLLARI